MKASSRHAVLAGFLGWTLDAFDFFVVVFLLDVLAAQFGVPKRHIVNTLTATLLFRPVGAVISGMRRPYRSCGRSSASGWEGSGASARRWRWSRRRGSGAGFSRESC